MRVLRRPRSSSSALRKRRLEAGVDVMLTAKGLSTEQKRRKNKRMIERLSESMVGLTEMLKKMRDMAKEGYEARQISLKLSLHRTGKKVSAKKSTLSAPEQAKQKLRISFLRRKAQAKKASPEIRVEPENHCEDSSVSLPS